MDKRRETERKDLEKIIGKEKMEKLDQINKERMEKREKRGDGRQKR
jgi:hypothetical protein